MKLDVIGFGALNVDKLYRVKRIARAGEESFITRYDEIPGGSAANTIVGLARLGMKVGFIGKIANDKEGKLQFKSLKEEKIDMTNVIISEEGESGIVIGFVDENGERALYVNPGVNDAIKFEEIDQTYLRNTKFLHFTSFVGEKPFKVQKKIIKTISEPLVSFDPGELYIQKSLTVLRPIIKKCYVLFLNEREQQILTGKDFQTGSKILLKNGAQVVAVKLGGKGCYVTNGQEKYLIDAYHVQVVDTTGAGDAYCAGFLYGLVMSKDLYTCGQLGNWVASCKIQKMGSREGLPLRSALRER